MFIIYMHNGKGKNKDVPLNCRAKLRFAWNGKTPYLHQVKPYHQNKWNQQFEERILRNIFCQSVPIAITFCSQNKVNHL